MRCATASRGGFTLLEVMIVIGMAALVFAISIPFVERTIHRDAIQRSIQVVEDACRNARATAILNNSMAELVIGLEDKAFSVRSSSSPGVRARLDEREGGDGDGDGDGATPRVSRHAARPFNGHLEDEVTIEVLGVNFIEVQDEEEARVRFHPNGTADEFTIVMRIGTTAWRKISLDVVTGLPTLEVIR